MPVIKIGKEQLEVSSPAYYALMEAEAEILNTIVEQTHFTQKQGFPDLWETARPFNQIIMQRIQMLLPQIEDKEIRQLLMLLHQYTNGLLETDEKLLDAMAHHFGLPPLRTEEERQHLRLKVESITTKEGWVDQEYLRIIAKSDEAAHSFRMAKDQFDFLIFQLRKALSYQPLHGEPDILRYPELQTYFERA